MYKSNVTCIVGGQYGSEGKGKISGYLASDFAVAVRVGAPNAGHSLKIGDKVWKMQQVPVAGLVNPDVLLVIGAGGLICLDIFTREIEWITKQIGDISDRLFIDKYAGILEHHHREQEEKEKMFEGVGSTCEGVGAARRNKIMRKNFMLAQDVPELSKYITNTGKLLRNSNDKDKKIMLEGTQGTWLSLNHSHYPYCTSNDCLSTSMLSDTGLPPQSCERVILVIRSYPIRVAGNSGPMCGKELTWQEVSERSGYLAAGTVLEERTTVTKRIRRVCEFNMAQVVESCRMNGATEIALMFADYITHDDYGKSSWNNLSSKTKEFVKEIEVETGVPVMYIGTGFDWEHIVDRKKSSFITTYNNAKVEVTDFGDGEV